MSQSLSGARGGQLIGLDANILVRYIMLDDVRKRALATRLIESLSQESTGFIPLLAVVELVRVLSSAYELERPRLIDALHRLLRAGELVIESAEPVWKALGPVADANADFAVSLIERSAAAIQCQKTVTLDRGAARGVGKTLLSSPKDL